MNDANEIEVIRSGRRTVAIELRSDMSVVVRAPYRMPESEIRGFIADRAAWLEKHKALMKQKIEAAERQRVTIQKLTAPEIRRLEEAALEAIPRRAAILAEFVGVSYGKITIGSQLTRWGSCSVNGNLSFNCLLMLTPPEVVDYVVVHELCHRRQWSHSPGFWAEVGRVLPDYKTQKKWLKDNGGAMIQRLK